MLDNLIDNPPDESLLATWGKNKDVVIPSKFDLRNVDGKSYVTSVKNQNPYGTCWAHAASGAMESNYLMQGGEALDLSEMHLAWFTYINADKTKAFEDYTYNGSVAYYYPRNYTSLSLAQILDMGGNSLYPAALYGRLDGPVLESEAPYPFKPAYDTPEQYTRVLRLRDVYHLGFSNNDVNVNDSATQRNIVKRRIMQNGAVVANYYETDSGYDDTNTMTSYYYKTSSRSTNHAIQIIGWDDTYSRSNFKTRPSIDGAWLIKNSWGTSSRYSGYTWMSYANYINDGSSFIVEPADPDMKAYYYDPLGWTGGQRGGGGANTYVANAFNPRRCSVLHCEQQPGIRDSGLPQRHIIRALLAHSGSARTHSDGDYTVLRLPHGYAERGDTTDERRVLLGHPEVCWAGHGTHRKQDRDVSALCCAERELLLDGRFIMDSRHGQGLAGQRPLEGLHPQHRGARLCP